MKVTTGTMFNNYNLSLKEEESLLIEEIEGYTKTKVYLIEKLDVFRHYIDNFTNIDFNQLNTLDRAIPDKAIQSFTGQIGLDLNTLKRILSVIVQLNKDINKLTKKLLDVQTALLEEDLFKDILYKFNNKLSDEIVYTGYVFYLGFSMGDIRIRRVRCDKRIKKRINWGESNKKKAEILARGGIPFKVLERNDKGANIKDNEGEQWFVYHTNPFDFLWHWHKKRVNVLNSAYYKFRPTYYNNTETGGKIGNVQKLKHLVTNNSESLKNFFEYGV